MTDPAPPQRSSKRARLCSIENANRIATRVAEHVQGDLHGDRADRDDRGLEPHRQAEAQMLGDVGAGDPPVGAVHMQHRQLAPHVHQAQRDRHAFFGKKERGTHADNPAADHDDIDLAWQRAVFRDIFDWWPHLFPWCAAPRLTAPCAPIRYDVTAREGPVR